MPKSPKKKCCVSKTRCQRCPIRMLAEGRLPPGLTVKKRRLVACGTDVSTVRPVTLMATGTDVRSGTKSSKKSSKKSGRKARKGKLPEAA